MTCIKNMREGFHNEVFVSTLSALPTAERTIKSLHNKVLIPDKKYIKIAPIKREHHPDSEFKVIGFVGEFNEEEEDEDITFRGKNVHLFTSLRQDEKNRNACASEDVWELLITLDMLMQSGANKIYLYYFYQIGQRQHKKRIHEPFTAALALRLAQCSAGGAHILRNVCIIHPHNMTSSGFLQGTKVDDLLPLAPATLLFKNLPDTKNRNLVTVATDGGSEQFNRYLKEVLGAKGPIVLNKDREKGSKPISFISAGEQHITKDAIYIIGDDIISTGDSGINAKKCIEQKLGHEILCYMFATNGCFNKPKDGSTFEERIRKEKIKIIISDTIPRSEEYLKENSDWLTMYSIGDLLSDVIICNVLNKSTGVILKEHLKKAKQNNADINKILINNKIHELIKV